jgi:FixJ family two-component response regulator
VPSEPDSPDKAYEKAETRERVRAAIQSLPPRERKVIAMYYYAEVTMKDIGSEIGVNESRVSQLHARAIRRLREHLGQLGAEQMSELKGALMAFAARKPVMAKAPIRQVAQVADFEEAQRAVQNFKATKATRPLAVGSIRAPRAARVAGAR